MCEYAWQLFMGPYKQMHFGLKLGPCCFLRNIWLICMWVLLASTTIYATWAPTHACCQVHQTHPHPPPQLPSHPTCKAPHPYLTCSLQPTCRPPALAQQHRAPSKAADFMLFAGTPPFAFLTGSIWPACRPSTLVQQHQVPHSEAMDLTLFAGMLPFALFDQFHLACLQVVHLAWQP